MKDPLFLFFIFVSFVLMLHCLERKRPIAQYLSNKMTSNYT